MKRKIECINFDLDSVLYIPSEFLETALRMSVKAMMQTGLKAGLDEALQKLIEIRFLNSNAKNHFNELCFYFNKKYDPLIIAAGIEKYWDCKIGTMTSAPETNLALSVLYKRYPLAIISNGPPLKQAGKIVRLGLSHFFSKYNEDLKVQGHYFYSTSDKTKAKPFPYLWLQSQKDIGYQFSCALMVGDRYWEDIYGANRLGMITVKISRGQHSNQTLEGAFENALKSEPMKTYFIKNYSKKEIMTLMKPAHTIDSLLELERLILDIEKNL